MTKAVVITGASQGLGFELAKEGLNRGFKMFVLDMKIGDELKKRKVTNFMFCNVI